MAKLKWEIIHECDMDDGTPTCWWTEINHPKHGRYCWINDIGSGYIEKGFNIEVRRINGEFIPLVECKSLASAKRWVATNLI